MRARLRAIRAARRQGRRGRSAPHRDGARGRRARRRSGPAATPRSCSRWCSVLVERRARRPRRSIAAVARRLGRRSSARLAPLHARSASRALTGVPAGDDRAPGARVRRRAVGASPTRASASATTAFGTLGDLGHRPPQPRRRAARRGRRRDVPDARRSTSRGFTAPGRRSTATTAGAAACAACPRRSAICPRRSLAEEIETPGAGPGPRACHLRRQPGALDAERPAARARRSRSSTSWSRSTST